MKPFRTILLLPMLLALATALAACGGDDAPTDEEYFRRMDEVDKEVDTQFEAICEGEEVTAKECAGDFAGAASTAEDLYRDVTPAEDVKDEHDELVAAIGEFGGNIETAAEDFQDDDPLDALFESGAVDDTRVNDAFCAIQALADEKNIVADVGCEEGGEEGPDPATQEPVETTEVLMQDFAFDPLHIEVTAGDTVTWEQGADPEPHNAESDDGSFTSFDPIGDEGETGEATFDEAGVFPYFCVVHPEMRGQVTVVE